MLQKPMPKQDKGGGINPRRGASVKVADSTAERQIFAAPPLAVFAYRSFITRGKPALDSIIKMTLIKLNSVENALSKSNQIIWSYSDYQSVRTWTLK